MKIKYPKTTVLTCSFVLLFASIALGETVSREAGIQVWESPTSDSPIQTAQWIVNDLVFRVDQPIGDPFAREAFAIVIGEDGEQKVPLFYNGDNRWVFRYSSSTTGRKSFLIESEIDQLDGRKGEFVVTANERPNRHGGIVLNEADPQHLYYEDGSHYFNLAFECDWLFALDYGQNDIPKTRHLLSLLDQYRFNQIG